MSTTRAFRSAFTARILARSAFALSLGGGVGASIAMAACSSDPARQSFEDDAQADGGAMVPEGGGPDTSPPVEVRPPFDPADEPVKCASTPCVTELVAGGDHFCARISDGTVRCWGDDTLGSLGLAAGDGADGGDAGTNDAGDGGALSAVRIVSGVSGVAQLSAGGATTCARLEEGGVKCWGGNQHGELGLSASDGVFDEEPHPAPTSVALSGAAARIDVGYDSACALLVSGKLACWGKDDRQQLARTGSPAAGPPVRGPGLADVDAVAAVALRARPASHTTLALTKTGEVWSWGAVGGGDGLVAGRVASVSSDPVPRRVGTLGKVTSLTLSGTSILTDDGPPPWDGTGPVPVYTPPQPRAQACAIAAGEIYCWGRSEGGALGTGIPDREPVPTHAPIHGKAWPQQLAAGEELTCARMTDGSVQCAGSDVRGRLGTGKVGLFSAYFVRADAFTSHAVQVAVSRGAVCALVQGGTVECWGSNEHGELGTSVRDQSDHSTPSKIGF